MDRFLILVVTFLALIIWIIKDRDDLTYRKMAVTLIAFYIFSCAFVKMGIPLYSFKYIHQFGSFGLAIRFELYLLLIPFLLIIIGRHQKWNIPAISKSVIISITVYIIYIFLNPYNTVKSSSSVAIVYILSYLFFLYCLTSCLSIKTLIKGIYKGFEITVIFHLILSILFPILEINSAITLFNSDALSRSADRAGAVGTMGHSNALGVYASYYLMFFFSCFLAKYRKKRSLYLAIISFIIIILSLSRSSLMASVFGVIMITVLYGMRQYSLFSATVFFKRVLPIVIIVALLLFMTPLYNIFFNSNMDEMVVARAMHYYCAYETFCDHPFVGVGLNSHLKYLIDNITLDFEGILDYVVWMPEDFMFSNPIHNIWLILLVELGLIGFIPIVIYIIRFFYLFKKRIKASLSNDYNIALMTGLGILSCMLVQGNSDWAPLSPQTLNIALLFLVLGATKSFPIEDDSNQHSQNYNKL